MMTGGLEVAWKLPYSQSASLLKQEDKRPGLHRAPPTLPTPAPPSSRRDKHWEREEEVRVGQILMDKAWAPGASKLPNPATTAGKTQSHNGVKAQFPTQYSDKTLQFYN